MQRDSPTWRTEGKTLPGPTASFCWGAARNVQDPLGNSLCRPEDLTRAPGEKHFRNEGAEPAREVQ